MLLADFRGSALGHPLDLTIHGWFGTSHRYRPGERLSKASQKLPVPPEKTTCIVLDSD